MKVEEEYEDVLQNIEFVIVSAFRRYPTLSDHAVARVLDAVSDFYAAEVVGRAAKQFGLSHDEQELFSGVKNICDWRLGREGISPYRRTVEIEPMTLDQMNKCLKRLLKSIRRWNREGGVQGYLQFVSKYF